MAKFRPYERGRVSKHTPAQQAAQQRNFRIFNLRGLYSHVRILTGWRRNLAQILVDLELRRMGAEPEGKRQAAREAEWKQFLD